MCQNGWFWTSELPEIDFTENLRDRKMMCCKTRQFENCGNSLLHFIDKNLVKAIVLSQKLSS